MTDETAGWTAFELPGGAVAANRNPQTVIVARLRIAHLEASVNQADVNAIIDDDLDTRWHADRQDGGETIVAELEADANPTAVTMDLGTYAGQYPRTIEVSTSLDGRSWDVAWSGDTALLTYDGAVQSPRAVPIAIPLRGTAARFIRLRQVGHDAARGWTIVELQVIQ